MLDDSGFFHQLPVHYRHRDRIVIISERGLEGSKIVPIGFKNLPSFVQRFIDRLFSKHRHFVRAYIDDIIIFSITEEEALEHLEILLEVRLHIDATKSFATYPAVKLLGYLVNGEGVLMTDDQIAAFKKIKFPDTLKSLEIYLGMTGWLRKGIAWYDVKATPYRSKRQGFQRKPGSKGRWLTERRRTQGRYIGT